jgi:predicted metal-dependent hydrolase
MGGAARGQASVMIGGRAVPLVLRLNRRARRLILKVDVTSGEVVAVAPSERLLRGAPDFARRHADWISRKLAQIPPRVPFAPGTEIPLRGLTAIIAHEPRARRGVWFDAQARALCVSGGAEHVGRRVADWLRHEARADLGARAYCHAAALGRRPSRITVRDTKSRWGSCSQDGALSFNWRLILAPPPVLDYVAAHEAAHLEHMDHGPRFQVALRRLIPDTERHEEWLRDHGPGLHRYGV